MLKFIRDNAKGVFAWIIIIIIIIPFALWGLNEYLDTGRDVTVARIGDREVLLGEFQNQYQRELAARGRFADTDANFKRQVLDRIVNSEVLGRAAVESGFRVPDAMVGSRIHAMNEFQRDGSFDREQYQRVLASAGVSVAAFEADMRRDLMMEQYLGGVTDTEFVTDGELDALLGMIQQRRRFAYLVLPASDYESRVQIDESRVESYYQQNRDQYAVPERVKVQYLELSMTNTAASIPVEEEALRELYEGRKAEEFTVGEERHARHILIRVPASADAAAEQAARAKAEEIHASIESGASFEEMARKHSEDTGSARSGGDLGFFGRGAMVGPFEDVVFAMKAGDVSGPVRTPFGFHLIKLEEVRPGSVRSFEEVRPMLEDEYRKGRAEARFFDLTDRLADLTFEHSDTLEVAAEELELEIKEAGPFSERQGTGIAADSAFRDAAFSPDVLEAGHNSPLIELADGRTVVLRVVDRQPASYQPLAEVRDRVEAALRREAIADMARRDAGELMRRAREGASLEALAREQGAEWHGPRTSARDDMELDPALLDALFAIPRPTTNGAPTIESVALPNGDHAVVALLEVTDGDPAAMSSGERAAHRDALVNLRGQLAIKGVIDSLRDRSDVKVYEDRL
jgi:peptidyl-prolyl cis-trans isomerase D